MILICILGFVQFDVKINTTKFRKVWQMPKDGMVQKYVGVVWFGALPILLCGDMFFCMELCEENFRRLSNFGML